MQKSRQGVFALWIASSPVRAKAIGLSCLLTAAVVLVRIEGIGAGLFTSLVLLMAGTSVVIALAPLRLLQTSYVLIFLVISLLFETVIFR